MLSIRKNLFLSFFMIDEQKILDMHARVVLLNFLFSFLRVINVLNDNDDNKWSCHAFF
jgi:hypothetical protein